MRVRVPLSKVSKLLIGLFAVVYVVSTSEYWMAPQVASVQEGACVKVNGVNILLN